AGIGIYDLGETALPLKVGALALPRVSALAISGRLLLAASAGGPAGPTLHVLDARRGDLAELGSMSLGSTPARQIAVEGTRAFVALGKAGQVAVVELTDPANPAPAGTLVLA